MNRELTFHDLARVHWPSTFRVGVARAAASSVFWTAVAGSIDPALDLPSLIAFFLIALPSIFLLTATAQFIGLVIPWIGPFVAFLGSLLVVPGDPMVYVLNRYNPRALSVADIRLFSLSPLIIILFPE